MTRDRVDRISSHEFHQLLKHQRGIDTTYIIRSFISLRRHRNQSSLTCKKQSTNKYNTDEVRRRNFDRTDG